jgi:hypothetical protein
LSLTPLWPSSLACLHQYHQQYDLASHGKSFHACVLINAPYTPHTDYQLVSSCTATAMQATRGKRYSSYSFSTPTLDGVSGQRHVPAALYPLKGPTG